jgi:Tol biopolymer transport system component
MAIPSGSRLGPYEVLAPIGAGGMGEVYRARDSRLDREVAVKVLPERVAQDPDALARFEREARAVASLNDAHVCVLFDVGTEDGVHFAVFELLEGDTLRERLSRGALPPSRAIELAMQLCQGLSAAHGKGIVHRDLKPENLLLTRLGLKILDFGLAKLQSSGARVEGSAVLSQAPTRSAPEYLTSPGTAPGTAAYMSPEQARGEPADARSDIFATGVVLFEMLSGKRPFRRNTHAETLTAILKDDLPELISPSGPVPPGLERITRRCLEKDPEDRFQSAHDLAFALEAVSGTSAPVQTPARAGRRWVWVGAAAALIALTGGLWIGWPGEAPEPLRVRPITSDPGPEWNPALSPDGHQVAFVKRLEGRLALYVKQVDGGEPLLISQGTLDSFGPAWSPDGLQIAFGRHVEGEDGEILDGIFVVPALGGAAQRLTVCRGHGHGLSWSPDQEFLAIADRESPSASMGIELLSLETGQRRRVTHPPAGYHGDYFPRYSPDGRTLAFVRAETVWVEDIYAVAVDGGEERRLTVGNHNTGGLDWAADGRSIVFSAFRSGGVGAYSLWRVPLSGGAPERLEFGDHAGWPTVARIGGRLAYEREEPTNDIWRVGGPTAAEGDRVPTRLISSTHMDYHPDYSPDGQHIAFVSGRSGAGEIWVSDADGRNTRQLTSLDDPSILAPSWSPDGELLAFWCPKEGSFDIYVVSVSGGFVRRLTTGPSVDGAPSWSRNGRWVYFFSNDGGTFEVWKVSPEGGDPIQVTMQGGGGAIESPDGRFLYYTKGDLNRGPPGLWRMPVEGGAEEQILDRRVGAWWTILDEGILYADRSSTPSTLELFDPDTGEVSRVAVLGIPPGPPGLSVSPDGRWVAYARGDGTPEADIILVENFE